ncbi:MAG: type II toxin-antitoxin system RelE/ParE family toxin [Verrucomicrobiota bacterium]
MAPHRDNLRPGLRRRLVGDYLVFYLIKENEIHVVRILHGARDLEAIFASSSFD